MCSISGTAGIISQTDIEHVESSCRKQFHRGPDAQGFWVSPQKNVVLGHQRLSIIDLNPISNQPFFTLDKKLAIVFNGEIYNHVEIRNELQKLGYEFATDSDTEVLLFAYDHWGAECLKHLNGMWAFVIWDCRLGVDSEKLFFSRDRAGEKPFYYSLEKGCMTFSSELNGLNHDRKINLHSLNYYLSHSKRRKESLFARFFSINNRIYFYGCN